MIYFDNAATSRTKPEVVYEAYNFYLREIGTSPGRGSYTLAIQASRMLYQARKNIASFFNIADPSNVIFTKNSTEAINLFFYGFLKQDSHVLISPYEHNAVLRPLQNLKNNGIIDYTVLPEDVIYNSSLLKNYVRSNTKVIALTLASNLTGQIVFSSQLAEEAKKYGITVFVDSSQGAGKKLVDIDRDKVDFLAFTGHKDLYAVPGVGGLVGRESFRINPLIQGGTGIHGESYVNPDAYPDSYEAGTLNMPAIWSLKTSIEYIEKNINEIISKENFLTDYFISKLSQISNVIIYNLNKKRVSTFSFNVIGIKSSDVVSFLSKKDICVRGGIHCAIKAHETINTVKTGAVRVSLNYLNTIQEIDTFISAVKELTECI